MLSFNLTVVLTVFVISIVLLISNRVRYDLIGIGSVFVMPESRLVGQQLSQIREAGRYNISVVGISAYGKKIFGRFRTISVVFQNRP